MTSHRTTRTAASLLAAALLLTACAGDPTGGTAAPQGAEGEVDTSDEGAAGDGDAMAEGVATDDGMAEDAGATDGEEAAVASPVLDVVATAPDGSTFTIADFAGETVFVETFATWCSTCRRQLGDTQEAAVAVGDRAVFLILSVETSIDPADLAAYAADHGFDDVRFGRLDDEGLAVLADHFGSSVLNAPSTPKFRVAADGSLSELTTGRESADEIVASLDA